MMLQFPNLDTLRLVLGGGQLPAEIAAMPVEAVFAGAIEPLCVRFSSGSPSKTVLANLKKLGIVPIRELPAGPVESFLCWAQLLPTIKSARTTEASANQPVLFELSPEEFPELVNEMLRLGNDRQSYRMLAGDIPRVLLRVLGPPYYTLLRAIDRVAPATVVAYEEASPGVWVQHGHAHPLQTRLKASPGQIILIRAGRDWLLTDDEPFADIYEALDVVLPETPVEWNESALKGKLQVPLRLAPGNAADSPDMWVIADDAVNQLDALVREADDRLIHRLAFAISQEEAAPPTIILKTRPSKLQPPALTLEKATGFKAFWKLPNLFLPVGRRLMPTLRRETVRRLLAEDPARVVWLMPAEGGADFTPESIPDSAFRPLEDWIDYVIDHDRDALASWVRATQFDFESFLCREEATDPVRDVPPPGKKTRTRKDAPVTPVKPDVPAEKPADSSAVSEYADVPERPSDVAAKADEMRRQREQMELDFLAVTGGLDAVERVRLWPVLARLNSSLNDLSESAICWANALWQESGDITEAAWSWLRGEDRDARRIPLDTEFDLTLETASPGGQAVRALAVRTIYACGLKPTPPALIERLPAIRTFLEKNESILGVRTVWLAWTALTSVAGGTVDVLALARVRDRLLHRLFTEGLNKERDLPCFLRAGGERSGERMRGLRERALRLFRLVAKWHEHDDVRVNRPYVELMFAFGFAKLGETTTARELTATALKQLIPEKTPRDPVHEFLGKAFAWRIENAVQGLPHAGPLPETQMSVLAAIDKDRNNSASAKYVIDRMREEYWLLEPGQKTRAYATWYGKSMEQLRSIAELAEVRDPARLQEAIRKILKNQTAPEGRVELFARLLPHAARAGETLALELLAKVPATLAESQRGDATAALAASQCQLLEEGLRVAGHFERKELTRELFNLFLEHVNKQKTPQARYEAINRIAGEGIRNLRRLGLRDEIDRFLKEIESVLLDGKSIEFMRRTSGGSWPALLVALLNLAEGWQFFGDTEQAGPILEEARRTLLANAKEPKEKRTILPRDVTKIARAYIAAAAQGPIHDALNRVEELFHHLEKLPNTFTTASHFSRLHLDIVEEIVRSLIHDNLADSGAARRWLDEDEFLVRRRIHYDFQAFLEQSRVNS